MFKQLSRLGRTFFCSRLSTSQSGLIKADALLQYKHFDEALVEAEKARDDKYATTLEVVYAKGKIIQVLNAKSKHEQSVDSNVTRKFR